MWLLSGGGDVPASSPPFLLLDQPAGDAAQDFADRRRRLGVEDLLQLGGDCGPDLHVNLAAHFVADALPLQGGLSDPLRFLDDAPRARCTRTSPASRSWPFQCLDVDAARAARSQYCAIRDRMDGSQPEESNELHPVGESQARCRLHCDVRSGTP